MYRNYYEGNKDLFLPMMKLNLMEHSFEMMSKVYGTINENMKQIVSKIASTSEEAKEIIGEFFVDSSKLTNEFVPEFLSYFLFKKYDEEKFKKVLEKTIGWRRPSGDGLLGHYDCNIHDAAGYLFKELNGVNVLEPDIAVMIRFGQISKEDAEQLIRVNEPMENNVESSLNILCDLCGYSRENMQKNISMLKNAEIGKFESR